MKSNLSILVGDRMIVCSPDGTQLFLRTNDGQPINAEHSDEQQHDVDSIDTIGRTLANMGLPASFHPDFKPAKSVMNYLIGGLLQRAALVPDESFIASFASAQLKVQWVPPTYQRIGHWLVGRAVDPRLEIEDTTYIIEKVRELSDGVWAAVERMLRIAGTTIQYMEVGETMHDMMRLTLNDMQIVTPKVEAV